MYNMVMENMRSDVRRSNIRREYNPSSLSKRRKNRRSLFNANVFKLSFCAFIIVFVCLAAIINVTASNSIENVSKQYKSILIDEGDTLWNIAEINNNQTLSCISHNEYIEDVMAINNISSESITAGNYIIIPIYVAQE